MNNKVFWKSKSMLFGFITALSSALSIAIPAFSSVSPFMSKNEAIIGMFWGVLAMVLRAVSKDKIVLGE
jgi:hypothetical protein